jgi:hypothetical protein
MNAAARPQFNRHTGRHATIARQALKHAREPFQVWKLAVRADQSAWAISADPTAELFERCRGML